MRRALISATLTGLLLLSACGGDDEESSNDDSSSQESENDDNNDNNDNGDSDETVPEISVGNIPGVSEDCEGVYSAYLSLFATIGVPGAAADNLDDTIDGLQDALPDELDDDAVVLATAFGAYIEALGEFEDNPEGAFADPDVLAASEALSSEEVTEANENITAYFEEVCPEFAG